MNDTLVENTSLDEFLVEETPAERRARLRRAKILANSKDRLGRIISGQVVDTGSKSLANNATTQVSPESNHEASDFCDHPPPPSSNHFKPPEEARKNDETAPHCNTEQSTWTANQNDNVKL